MTRLIGCFLFLTLCTTAACVDDAGEDRDDELGFVLEGTDAGTGTGSGTDDTYPKDPCPLIPGAAPQVAAVGDAPSVRPCGPVPEAPRQELATATR